jgi:hypothetical protein
MLSVAELLKQADLPLTGSAKWKTQIPERSGGVYIITITEPSSAPITVLPKFMQCRWNHGQEIVYIGRSVNLQRRLSQFYRHTHGQPRPHRGGEDIILLKSEKMVFWVQTPSYADAEHRLLEMFKSRVGQIPFGNRVRSARMNASQ